MSLETWKAEFYPVKAQAVPKERAAAHSLKKWEGLREEGLGRHGCKLTDWEGDVRERMSGKGEVFRIDAGSCALCMHFRAPRRDNDCLDCPLSKVRDEVSCDSHRPDETEPPYQLLKRVVPEPMIGWLKKAVELEAGAAS